MDPSLWPTERGKQKHNSETNYETEAKCGAMMTKYQQQHHQHILQEQNTGQVKGTMWGAIGPPESPSEHTGRCTRVQKYRGLAVHSKKMQGVSPTHTKTS